MANKILVVVDMQNDFIDGALGTEEARGIVKAATEEARDFEGEVVFTLDTHPKNYLQTQEGRNLPVEHCIRGTRGWQLAPSLLKVQQERHARVFEKPAFGSTDLADWLVQRDRERGIDEVEFIGLCTDICVVSNALLAKAVLPEVLITVKAGCCAGVSPAAHEAALATMRSCQVQVL